jgi:hypothetical protein
MLALLCAGLWKIQFSKLYHTESNIQTDWLKSRALGNKEMTAVTQMPYKL